MSRVFAKCFVDSLTDYDNLGKIDNNTEQYSVQFSASTKVAMRKTIEGFGYKTVNNPAILQ